MPAISGLFAYLGPETFLPMTSVLATVAGLVLMFWRTGTRLVLKLFAVRGRSDTPRLFPSPSFAVRRSAKAVIGEGAGER
jgi:hypothetical protein